MMSTFPVDLLKRVAIFCHFVVPLLCYDETWFSTYAKIHNDTCPSDCMGNSRGVTTVDIGINGLLDDSSVHCCGYCECSSDCIKYGSCCLTQYGNLTTALSAADTRFQCVRPQFLTSKKPKYPPMYEVHKFWMVTKCASATHTDDVNRKLCERTEDPMTIESITPVIGVDITYRNKYCACCNGVNMTQPLKSFDIGIFCDSGISLTDENLHDTMRKLNCSVYFWPPENEHVQRCHIPGYQISSCNETGKWPVYNKSLEDACLAILDPFNATYKNYFCYLCNEDNPLPQENWSCKGETGHVVEIFPPFTAIINLGSVGQAADNQAPVCKVHNQFWDTKMMLCRNVYCPEGFRLLTLDCFSENQFGNTNCYQLYVKLTPQNGTYLIGSEQDNKELAHSLMYIFYRNLNVIEKLHFYKKVPFSDDNFVIENMIEYVIMKVVFNVTGRRWPTLLSDFLQSYHNVTSGIFYSGSMINLDVEIVSVSTIADDQMLEVLIMGKTGHTVNLFNEMYPNGDSKCIGNGEFLFNKLLFCPFVILKSSEFSLMFENGFLIIKDNITEIILPNWQYEKHGDIIHICLDDYQYMSDVLSWSHATIFSAVGELKPTQLLSLICVCVSITCLFVTIFAYLFIPKLQTQPGVNNIILCVSLLLAQVFYQFGSGQRSLSPLACSVLGVICHFLWLSVMFSMNSCCIHMFIIFKHSLKLSPRFNMKTTMKSILYVIGSSLAFVCLNLVISISRSAGKESGYGGSICYLSTPLMHTITFIFPSAATIVTNVVLFSYVIYRIRKASVSAEILNQERNYFGVYARLSTITGLTWIFGYVHIFLELEIIEYLFIVFNACQGLFIMIGFILNKRVCTVYRRLTPRKRDTISDETRNFGTLASSSFTEGNTSNIVNTIST